MTIAAPLIEAPAPYEPTSTEHTILRQLRSQRNAVTTGWVQGVPHRDEACLVWRGNPEVPWGPNVHIGREAWRLMSAMLAWSGETASPEGWNDGLMREQKDVLAFLDASIERVETWGIDRLEWWT